MISDEFRFLENDSQRVNRLAPLPKVKRIMHTAPSGRTVSALVTEDPLARNSATTVFLHGAGLNAHSFDPTALALQDNSISLDLPGHGRSDWRKDATYTPETLAEDVAATIRGITTTEIHLVGQSLGGLTAAAIALSLRDRMRTLTLIDVTPGITPSGDAGSIGEFISGKRDFASIDEMVDRAIEFQIGHDRAALTRGVALNTRQRRDGRFEWTHHFAHLDGLGSTAPSEQNEYPFAALWEPLESLGGLVTQIRGSEGIVTNRLQSEWRNRLPHAEVITINGGHNLHEHAPKELATALQKIIAA